MGPLAQKAKALLESIQKHEDAKVNEVASLEESNKALKARVGELEAALRDKDVTIGNMKANMDSLQQELTDLRSVKTMMPPILSDPPREPRPIGAGKSAADITAMALAAATGQPRRR